MNDTVVLTAVSIEDSNLYFTESTAVLKMLSTKMFNTAVLKMLSTKMFQLHEQYVKQCHPHRWQIGCVAGQVRSKMEDRILL